MIIIVDVQNKNNGLNVDPESDVIYDPFAGRGTSLIEAALNQRNFICNDINPLSKIFIEP